MMGVETKIQWTDATFNPWWGCTRVSPGCHFCYAETFAHRFGVEWGKGKARRLSSEKVWAQPLAWNKAAAKSGKPFRVFSASMADIFDDEVPQEWRERFFDLVRDTPALTWQILTKRPENFARFLPAQWGDGWNNVWLGVSVEDRRRLDRLSILRETPARVRFVSAEPLLEDLGQINMDRIDWIIIGGESGQNARHFHLAWARSLLAQCRAQGVSPFIKQLGADPRDFNGPQYFQDKKSGDIDEWPADLRVREFPKAAKA